MSLLNQVLQDLDDRAPPGESRQVRLTVAPAPETHADNRAGDGPDRVRLGAGMAIVIAFVVAVWTFYTADEGRVQRAASVQPVIAQLAKPEIPAPVSEPVASVAVVQSASHAESVAAPSVVVAVPAELVAAKLPGVFQPVQDALPEVGYSAPEPAPAVSVQPSISDTPGVDAAKPSSQVTYLPLRNTELPAVQEPAPKAAKAGVNVKTPQSAAPQVTEQARQAIEQGELASAEALLQQRLRHTPGDRYARELLVGLMLRGERHDAAMQELDKGLQQHPGHVTFSLIKARLLAQMGNTGSAINVLEPLASVETGRVERLQMLGALYQQQSRFERAVDAYRSLLEIDPSVGSFWVGLAISMDGLGDAAALQAYGRALRLGGLPAAAETYARQRVGQMESRID